MQTDKLVPETESMTHDEIAAWVEQYLLAWRSNDPADIAALFTEDAEYHESPFDTHWLGRDAIVEGWRDRWDWQQGGWTFTYDVQSVHEREVVIHGVGRYKLLGNFDNVWTVAFDPTGRGRRFDMINNQQEENA